ncbi:ABC transporter A family [Klebsormidium nitens]|uniref:ABC transporter A family n=1 Tax=Klebsormidium nitens TaxID=105231 RepID=A0A1Y1HQP2_KLENI|nr:ABC transporter A family [Klebsormidium nitens]|eukprot:GAQ79509.1 ABC transporter A family [Klebsormidium nitens]
MGRFWRLLSVLLWKNWLLKKRHPLSTALEVLLPVCVLVLLMVLRTQVDHTFHATTAYITPKTYVRVGASDASAPFPAILDHCARRAAHIAFVPGNSSWVQDMVALLSMQFPKLKEVALLYPDEAALEAYVQTREYGTTDPVSGEVHPFLLGAVVFHSTGPAYDYSLRLNHSWAPSGFPDLRTIMDTKGSGVNDLFLGLNLISQTQYALSGFLTLQQVVDSYIIFSSQEDSACRGAPSRLLCSRSFHWNLPEHVAVAPFPTPGYTDDSFQAIAKKVMAVLYLLGFMFPISRLLRHMVLEKEDRLKEGMAMMGMTDTAVNTAWLITYGVQFGVTSAVITAVTWSSLFAHSDKSVVFAYFFVFGLSSIGLCFLLSTFFSRARTAASVGALAFLGAFFPYYTLVDPQAPGWARVVGSLSSPTAFALGTANFADYEQGHVGLRWSNIFQPSSGINFGVCLLMMLLDGLLYCGLGWYADKVLPREHGVARPWYFPLLRSYWAPVRPLPEPMRPGRFSRAAGGSADLEAGLLRQRSVESVEQWESGFSSDSGMSDVGRGEAREEPRGEGFEAVGRTLRRQEKEARCVVVSGLRKDFGGAVAVAGVDLVLYEGQITALLGHNGAGKSTTIAMLTGLVPPSAGDADVRGKSIHTHMDAIRRQLGVCPQHDILFPELTVEEHLQLFATLKDVDRAAIPAQVANMIQSVGLADKRHARAASLSGGMKRKLSVAIALLGGSRVVILDEPSAGMDPYSQRAIWRLLKRSKAGRCILLTTHSMEEADALGDRIAIMSHGMLRAAASSLYLKNRFGVGYTLTLIKKADCDSTAIEDTIRRHVPVASLVNDVASELAFRLPLAHTAAFPALFHDLDAAAAAERGIAGYGVSVTTLEEVFLRIARGDAEQNKDSEEDRMNGGEQGHEGRAEASVSREGDAERGGAKEGQPGRPGPTLSKVGSSSRWVMARVRRKMFWKHCRALLRKRWLCAVRDVRGCVFQLVIPALFLLLGLTLLLLKPHPNLPAVHLDFHEFNGHILGKQPTAPVPINLTFPLANEVSPWLRSGFPQPVTAPSFVFPRADRLLEKAVAAAGPDEGPALLNMSAFLIESRNLTYESRYGAVLFGPRTASGAVGYSILHNTTAQHAAPLYINLVNDALLKAAHASRDVSIATRNHPLPQSYSQRRQRRDIGAFSASIIVCVAFAFIPASFAVAVVKERETGAKAQQVLSGVSLTSYWVSTALWDGVSYLLPASLALALFALFGVDEFIGAESLLPTALLLLAYGPAVAALTYCLTFAFTHHAAAQNAVLLVHLFTGLLLSLASFIMSLIKNTRHTSHTLKAFFRLFPGFCLADGLSSLALRQQGLDPDLPSSALAWDVSGANIVYLLVEAAVYFSVALLLDHVPPLHHLWYALPAAPAPWSRRAALAPAYSLVPSAPSTPSGPGSLPPSPRLGPQADPASPYADEDADVAAERARVEGPAGRGSLVRLSGLRKVYPSPGGGPSKVAVQSLSFGIGPGECFGFLGVNGAGKTTTLGMLTGEVAPSDGTAFVVGNDIRTNQTAARRLVGYCPQRDPLLELLTPREHLQLYARIKGVPEKNLPEVVEAKLKELELVGCADVRAGVLSGGNKRKLSVAQAMVGDPPIIILDEPSTGMDPAARRFLWDVVSRLSVRAGRCAVLLTTHSMAEAQALCSTIGIMTAGRLRCLGSPQHLKTRFGAALELEVKAVTPSLAALALLCERVMTSIPALLRYGHEHSQPEDAPASDVDALRAGLDLAAALPAEAVVAAACALGDEDRAALLLGGDAGAAQQNPGEHDASMTSSVQEQLAHDGWLSVQTFCEWWLVAEQSSAIDAFVRATFPGAALLEHTAATFRYQLPREGGRSLAQVFAAMEAQRAAVGIAEYSVGQTTLEAIFNNFAARQEDADRG